MKLIIQNVIMYQSFCNINEMLKSKVNLACIKQYNLYFTKTI